MIIVAAGVILRAPSGRVLILRRSSEGDAAGLWAWPGGKLESGEDAAAAATRETLEETGYKVGELGYTVMRSVQSDTDYTTFMAEVEEEFTPVLNSEHTAFAWVMPAEVVGPHV